MSNNNNKFWNKDKNVKPISDDADLENTVKESLEKVISSSDVIMKDESGFIDFKTVPNKVDIALKVLEDRMNQSKVETINEVLDVCRKHNFNMMDEITRFEAEKVIKWMEQQLTKKGML